MLLRARFLWFTFFFGVRVGAVIDERRETDEGPQQVWGFNYQTLAGHFERGQMDFTIIKWLESGRVAFHIHAFSQPAEIANPFYRLGFKLFGRMLQKRFARRSVARMQRLVKERMAAQIKGEPTPVVEAAPVRPASATTEAAAALEDVKEQVGG
jgi:hypothetical protein